MGDVVNDDAPLLHRTAAQIAEATQNVQQSALRVTETARERMATANRSLNMVIESLERPASDCAHNHV